MYIHDLMHQTKTIYRIHDKNKYERQLEKEAYIRAVSYYEGEGN